MTARRHIQKAMQGRLWLAAALLALVAGCASAPKWPDPQPGSGQIVVQLRGVAREGVSGPKTERVQGEYAAHNESVERGQAFERVRYDRLEDVVVVLEHHGGKAIAADPAEQTPLVLGRAGFSSVQYAAGAGHGGQVLLRNDLGEAVEIFASSQSGEFHSVQIAAGATQDLALGAGIYDLTCDAMGSASCRLVVTRTGRTWRGSAHESAFWDGLEPGKYVIGVYAPRLPVVVQTVNVAGGERQTLLAELTVNTLPRARR